MERLGRIVALLAVLALVGSVAALTVPERLDGPEPTPAPNDRCGYFYTAIETVGNDPTDVQTATRFENLPADRRAAFEMRLASDGGAVQINNSFWRSLYAYQPDVHYVLYNNSIYRADVSLNGCAVWEALANRSA